MKVKVIKRHKGYLGDVCTVCKNALGKTFTVLDHDAAGYKLDLGDGAWDYFDNAQCEVVEE